MASAWVRPDSVPEGFCVEGCGRKAKPGFEFRAQHLTSKLKPL